MRNCWLAPMLLFAVSAANAGEARHEPPLDWSAWRSMPVQGGGRHKPLDTLARESLRTISNRGSITDPETGETLSPVAFWLSACFDWQGWRHSDRQRLLNTLNWE